MRYKRILILGSPGSGKSTFARRLSALTGIPVVHLDKLFWKPGWVQSAKEEFYPALLDALMGDAWIIDGNYATTLPWRLKFCDQVIYFNLPRLVCQWGILSRFFKFRRRIRPDITEGCPEKIDREFWNYTWDFREIFGVQTAEMIVTSGKPVVWFLSRRDVRRFLEDVKNGKD